MSCEECTVCGCSSEFDEVGDRICHCDSCYKQGCQYTSQYHFTDGGKKKIFHKGIKHIVQDKENHYTIGNSTIVNIHIPNGVEKIDDCAFLKYTALETIFIPNTVKVISNSAFDGCSSLKEVIFEEGSVLEMIGPCAFMDTSVLESIVIPDTVNYIGQDCFRQSGIRSIILPKNLTDLPS